MIKLEIKGADIYSKKLNELKKSISRDVQGAFNDWADRVSQDSKQIVSSNSSDEGMLMRSIAPRYGRGAEKGTARVVASAIYASYIEFGTRKFAEAYVGSLPKEWQDIAQKSKGSTGGTFNDLLLNIYQWIERKGFASRYSVKTKKKLKSNKSDQEKIADLAFAISYSIIKNGIRPKPFLYPAVNKETPQLLQDIKDIFKGL